DGSFLLLNQDFFESATGVDSNLSQIQSNKKRFHDLPKMSFTTTNDLIDGHLNAKFDVVTCMEVIEHCALPERELVLKNLNALLKPGGHVVISVPIEIGPTLLFKQLFRRIAGWRGIGDYKYIEPYSMSELIKMVMATQNTEINRPVHEHVNPPAPPLKLHSHKGFNWRALKKRLNQDFIIDQTYFSPIPINQGLVNSQVFFVCRKPDSTQ
ncbi:MAG: methyltransferase, partial [Oligoflexia bacterium]|nr:methyltransferase [Oligoflexia bacterium]